MKSTGPQTKMLLINLALALCTAGLDVQAANDTRLAAAPESKLWLDGNSTLHKFKSSATKMTIAMTVASDNALPDAVKKGDARSIDVVIPIEGLKSGERGLDKNMYKALKADKFPEIHFKMDRYEIAESSDGAPVSVKASGKLTIDGVEKDVALNPEVSFTSSTLRIRGTQELLMRDYGVEPPTLMLGTIKVDNRILIGYDLVMRLQ